MCDRKRGKTIALFQWERSPHCHVHTIRRRSPPIDYPIAPYSHESSSFEQQQQTTDGLVD
ncbi:MAG: hypothetical protein F6K09_25430 [Merismopedia sp. SIO2A8]|nr:hypothetical protein [Merismopedia sp. SIO2A8]